MLKGGDDHSASRVPPAERSQLVVVTLVRIGAMTSLSQFMVGAALGNSMSFLQAVMATVLGSLVIEFVSLGLGIAGAREGLSTSLLARWCGFGRYGSVLIGALIGVSLLGWFGIQNAVFANALNSASNGKLGFAASAAISGGAITIIVAFGFRALSWTAKLVVPLFFAVVLWSMYRVVGSTSVVALLTALPSGKSIPLGVGATVVAGGYIAGALITPDLSRYCQNSRHVFWMTFSSIIVGEFVVNTMAILIAHAVGSSDVTTILTQTAGWIGLITVILSAVKINDINLYSSSLAIGTAIEGSTGIRSNRAALTVLMGVIGTGLSIAGILDQFVGFLIILGVTFPPIAGVMLVDYFVLGTSREELDSSRKAGSLPSTSFSVGWAAIGACALGTTAGLLIKVGIPSLTSLIVAAATYWIARISFQKSIENGAKESEIYR
jgi:cytosine permease